jgi:probable HAF family extracellular repeat protein
MPSSCLRACAILLVSALAWPLSGGAAPSRYTVTPIPGLNPEPLSSTSAVRINKLGQVAGNIMVVDTPGYFIWDGSTTRLVPGIRADSSVEMGLNDRGEFVGDGSTGSGSIRPFVYRNGQVAYLGAPDGGFLSATRINNAGQIAVVGFGTQTRSGIAQDGRIDWLAPPPSAVWTVAEAINERGQLAGAYGLASGGSHAFTTRDGVAVDLGLPGTYGVAKDINEGGDVVGSFLDPQTGDFLPYLYHDGVAAALPHLGYGGDVFAINNLGTMVGLSGAYEGALWEDGQVYLMSALVDGPAWDYLEVRDINDAGQIAGTACRLNQGCQAVIFNPVSAVPEAPQWAMLGLGLLPLVARRLRRRPAHGPA